MIRSQEGSQRPGLIKGVLAESTFEDRVEEKWDKEKGDAARSFVFNMANGKLITPMVWPIGGLFSEESRRLIGRQIVAYGGSEPLAVDQGNGVQRVKEAKDFVVRTIVVLPEIPGPNGDGEKILVDVSLSENEDSWGQLQMSHELVIVAVESKRGIGKMHLHRVGTKWPSALIVRLTTKGLESMRVSDNRASYHWEVSSHPPFAVSLSVEDFQGERRIHSIQKTVFGELVMKVGPKKIPLPSGYFELAVAPRLLQANSDTIEIRWIDFYRN